MPEERFKHFDQTYNLYTALSQKSIGVSRVTHS